MRISDWSSDVCSSDLGSQRIAAALAAGCSIVVKPPEEAVVSIIELARILADCGLPPGTLNVILGPGETVGEQLVSDPRVDLVSLTGGVETGARVMAAAARRSEEHTSELQSLMRISYAVFCLKKKKE